MRKIKCKKKLKILNLRKITICLFEFNDKYPTTDRVNSYLVSLLE